MIVGIDPGLTGAVAFLDGESYFVEDMPVMAHGKGHSRVKNQVNPVELAAMLNQSIELVVIERVNSMPGQGSASIFSLGDTYGCIRGVVGALGLPMEAVNPREWKKYYNINSDKEIARARAIERYPKVDLSKKKHHNKAEALLIARYGEMKLMNR